MRQGVSRARCSIPGDLLNAGWFSVDVNLFGKDFTDQHLVRDALRLEVQDSGGLRGDYYGAYLGAIRPSLAWHTAGRRRRAHTLMAALSERELAPTAGRSESASPPPPGVRRSTPAGSRRRALAGERWGSVSGCGCAVCRPAVHSMWPSPSRAAPSTSPPNSRDPSFRSSAVEDPRNGACSSAVAPRATRELYWTALYPALLARRAASSARGLAVHRPHSMAIFLNAVEVPAVAAASTRASMSRTRRWSGICWMKASMR